MSYYNPSFNQSVGMSRGRGGGFSPRGSYRGSRGSSWSGSSRGSSRGGYSPRTTTGRFPSSMNSSYDRPKFGEDRFRSHEDYSSRKNYRDTGYGRDRSPDRKRMRVEAPSSRHDSYGGGSRYSDYSDRRGFSGDRHSGAMSRRDDFRRPSGPPPSSIRGGYRGRLSSSRGSRRPPLRLTERPRRRLIESSYAVRKRIVVPRTTDYARRLKITKMRSAIAGRTKVVKKDKEAKDDDDEDEDDEAKEEKDEDETKAGEKSADEKSPKKVKTEPGAEDKEEESDEEQPVKRNYIKLCCPHCDVKAFTFHKYEMHLSGRQHMITMSRVAHKQKSILSQMRQAQRNTQNELEKTSDELLNRTNYCPLCKLNYKQHKAVHQSSEGHKNMKKFLMPYCKVCNITFKSPMIYESHCCSIEHIKRKQRVEDASDGSEVEDLENFTTIDSVGDGDDAEEKPEEAKEIVNVGLEQIRKVESFYCDLCKMYLPRADEPEMSKILQRHCKLRVHMSRYVRFKELQKRAERLQRRETAEKEASKKKKEGESSGGTAASSKSSGDAKKEPAAAAADKDAAAGGAEEEDAASTAAKDEEEATEDKIWEDVDKDLGDIIAEAESGNKSCSDEDEEDDSHMNGERYDRFKLSEKNGEEKLKGEEKKEAAADEKKTEAKEEKK